ncbi:MAG TPA: TIM barrel protein [Candidatus Acidoferrales bacterium]|jgi:inosose dehydratase|nr:TIM barrel protein [Candidatus Acidoferrales bacterium]
MSAIDRRNFAKTLALGACASAIPAGTAPARKLHIGHTCITWGSFPRPGAEATIEPALRDMSAEGFWSFETFPELLDTLDQKKELQALIEKYGVPVRSGYITVNLIDPAKRKEEVERVIRLSRVVQKYQGTFIVLAPNGVKRDSYNFQERRAGIISGLNEYAMAVTDLGLGTGLHQHTGTAIESRDEVYAVMEAVDTKHLKFAPDVGQLQKGGADAAKVVKDFLPILKHMHLKDYKGWEHFSGYCPLGMGKVDLTAVLDMVEAAGQNPNIMVELDPSNNAPMTPLETVKITKAWLLKQGFAFRS